MKTLNRLIIGCAGLAAGVLFGLALDDALRASGAPTFAQRWEPVHTMPAMRGEPLPLLEDYPAFKSDRGPCVDRRPRCKVV